jgi:predicted HTH domain antitoxin
MCVVYVRTKINNLDTVAADEPQMTRASVERSVELYRAEGVGLREAAALGGVPADDLADELRSRGVVLRQEDSRGTTRTWY